MINKRLRLLDVFDKYIPVEEYCNKEKKLSVFGQVSALILGISMLALTLLVGFVAMFIELPLQCILTTASLKDRYQFFISCWRGLIEGVRGDE